MEPIKVYVKYSKDYPYLPEAVADSKRELAEALGKSYGTVCSSYSHHVNTYAVVEFPIKTYADNDGGAWYFHPLTNEIIHLRD